MEAGRRERAARRARRRRRGQLDPRRRRRRLRRLGAFPAFGALIVLREIFNLELLRIGKSCTRIFRTKFLCLGIRMLLTD